MKKYRQRIVDNKIGDCFPACMATVLQLPIEVLPNDHSPSWHSIWETFLYQFGLSLGVAIRADGPLWYDGYWIAGVSSINYPDGTTHAIVMDGTKVFHDPSTKKRYKAGRSLLGEKVVQHGYHLSVLDATQLHRLEEYRKKISGEKNAQ